MSRSEDGFILMTVLLGLLLVTIVTVSIMGFLAVSQKVVDSSATGAARFRAIDGALETAVNTARSDGRLATVTGVLCSTITFADYEGYQISCTNPDLSSISKLNPNNDYRVLDFTVKSQGAAVGRARVRIDDRPPGSSAVLEGFRMQVCDWQIGKALAGSMEACPT